MAEPGEFLNPVSAMLTRALAEAAAGSPGESVYLVASYTAVPTDDDSNPPGEGLPPTNNGLFNIQPALPTYLDAKNRAEELGPGYGVFGPFSSTFAAPVPGQHLVRSIVMHTTNDGRVELPTPDFAPPQGIDAPPTEFDALFLTVDAVAKFALPYYSGIYGNGFGREVLTQFQRVELALMGHLPWSEYTDNWVEAGPGPNWSARGIPVLMHPDGKGGYHRQPIYPRAPATAGTS